LESEKYQAKLKKVIKRIKEIENEDIDKKTYKKLLKKCDLVEEKLKEKYTKINKRDDKKTDKDKKKKKDKSEKKNEDKTDKKDLSTGSSDEKVKKVHVVENPEDLTARG